MPEHVLWQTENVPAAGLPDWPSPRWMRAGAADRLPSSNPVSAAVDVGSDEALSHGPCRMPPRIRLRRARVNEYPIGGEAVLFNPATQLIHRLNATALTVWRACDGCTVEVLASLLSHRYDVHPRTALDDVRRLVDFFRAGGLITLEEVDEAGF